jgi:hypothetical protein
MWRQHKCVRRRSFGSARPDDLFSGRQAIGTVAGITMRRGAGRRRSPPLGRNTITTTWLRAREIKKELKVRVLAVVAVISNVDTDRLCP